MKKFTVVFLSILIVAFSFTACSSKPNNKLTEKNITNTIHILKIFLFTILPHLTAFVNSKIFLSQKILYFLNITEW